MDGAVARVTFQRPPVNALTPDFMRELHTLFTELPRRPGIRAVLFRSGIPGRFMAGGDFAAAREWVGDGTEAAIHRSVAFVHATMDLLDQMPLPTIAAIAGHCVGGGLELALACDFRLMAADGQSRIGLPELEVGIIPGAGGTQRLPRVVGLGHATDMILRARRLTADEADRIGLVRAVPPDRLEDEARALAAELGRGPTVAYAAAKAALRASFGPMDQGLAAEKDGWVRVAASQDAVEGVQAFFARRPPQFRGR